VVVLSYQRRAEALASLYIHTVNLRLIDVPKVRGQRRGCCCQVSKIAPGYHASDIDLLTPCLQNVVAGAETLNSISEPPVALPRILNILDSLFLLSFVQFFSPILRHGCEPLQRSLDALPEIDT
jgi:hypothetical protein